MPSNTAAVEFAARTAATCRTLKEGRHELMELGIEEDFAARLLFLVPHAFGAVYFGRQGIAFCPTFLDGPAGYDPERRFSDEPAYAEALALAEAWLDSGELTLFHAACDWSEQVAIARDRLGRGLPLDDLRAPPRNPYLVIPWYGGPPRRPSEM